MLNPMLNLDQLKKYENNIKKGKVKIMDLPKEYRIWEMRVRRYKKRNNKKRISRADRIALADFTPKQVEKGNKNIKSNKELLDKRLKEFDKKYRPTMGEINEGKLRYYLEYTTPKKAALMLGWQEIPELPDDIPEINPPENIKRVYFTPVVLPDITWEELPDVVKYWSHKAKNYLYNNGEYLWSGSPFNPADCREDGNDHNQIDFYKELQKADLCNMKKYYIDPNSDDEPVLIDKDEWDEYLKRVVDNNAKLSDNFPYERYYEYEKNENDDIRNILNENDFNEYMRIMNS